MPFNINEFISHTNRYGEYARSDKFDVRISVPKSLDGRTQGFKSKELSFQCEAAELPGRTINMIEYRHHAFIERIPYFNTFDNITLTFYCNNDFLEKKFFDSWIDSMVPLRSGLVKYFQDDSYENQFTSRIQIRQYGLSYGPRPIPEQNDGNSKNPFSTSQILSIAKKFAPDNVRNVINLVDNFDFDNLKKSLGLLSDSAPLPIKVDPIYKCTLVDAVPTAMSPLSLNWSDDGIHRLAVNFAYKIWKTDDLTEERQEPEIDKKLLEQSVNRALDGVFDKNFPNLFKSP